MTNPTCARRCDRTPPEGYEVITSEEGRMQSHLASRQWFDLAVVDMMLPGAKRFQVAQAVKDHRRAGACHYGLGESSPATRITAFAVV